MEQPPFFPLLTTPNASTRYFLDDINKSVEVRDDRGDTPLNTAAYAGQLAAARELVERGADVNTKNNKAW